MSTQVKFRRGTTSEHSSFTGSAGEITVDTTKNTVVVHNGSTAGGFPLVKEASLATVATTGAYSDLTGKPTLATVATTGAYSDLTGKPTLATVATTGAYSDLTGKPTLPSGAIVGTTDTQILTNKTVEAATFTNGYTEEVATANTGTAYTIDLANGSIQKLTLTGNCTYTFPTATAGKSFVLYQLQDATGSRTVTWPASVKWPSGTAPTLTSTASKADIFAFTADGTDWLGRTIGQAYL